LPFQLGYLVEFHYMVGVKPHARGQSQSRTRQGRLSHEYLLHDTQKHLDIFRPKRKKPGSRPGFACKNKMHQTGLHEHPAAATALTVEIGHTPKVTRTIPDVKRIPRLYIPPRS
jgi:hypothetical protein